jgi:hypothetical protein
MASLESLEKALCSRMLQVSYIPQTCREREVIKKIVSMVLSCISTEKERSLRPERRSPSPENSKGITIAAAKYSSEDAATLLNYTIAIVEYTRLCGPLRASLDRMTELQREIDENQRLQREKEQAVSRGRAFRVLWGFGGKCER